MAIQILLCILKFFYVLREINLRNLLKVIKKFYALLLISKNKINCMILTLVKCILADVERRGIQTCYDLEFAFLQALRNLF
jgi:hypothetical protein